jgi:hypothetical protein
VPRGCHFGVPGVSRESPWELELASWTVLVGVGDGVDDGDGVGADVGV